MKAFVITLEGNEYSEQKADNCIASGAKFGVEVEKYYGVNKEAARAVMRNLNLKWTWANGNKSPAVCPKTGLRQRPYYNANLDAKIGCAMSHYLLWGCCVDRDEPLLILEHDAVFVSEIPQELHDGNFKGILQINDPKGGGRNGSRLSQMMTNRGKIGVQPSTPNQPDPLVPDGLAGNGSYIIKPFAAQELIDKYHELGVWPNDATMCIQLFPYLEEYYPFITKIEQEISTSSQ